MAIVIVTGASDAVCALPVSAKPRLVVINDIGTEVDDQESMVRLLVYANEFDIEGLIASTSTHMRDQVHPELIEERVRAYAKVLPNLRQHAAGYPDAEYLLSKIRSSAPTYGAIGSFGAGKETPASRSIVEAADRHDARPLWIITWGGAKDLAQALWTVRATRSPKAVAQFVAKLRIYSIADEDEAAPWIRTNFPELFWITSIHAFTDYTLGTWQGVSAPLPGADPSMVSKPWLQENIRPKGVLGALYPLPNFIMEGDTPSLLYMIPNGLGSLEHPNWGSWGGRYGKVSPAEGLWASASDRVKGLDGVQVTDNRATVWRWRSAFQNDFLARMNWSVTPNYADANHPPQLVLNGVSGDAPIEISACAGEPIALSAAGSRDPDGQPLKLRWWLYAEPTGVFTPFAKFERTEGETTSVTISPPPTVAKLAYMKVYQLHVILEATDTGSPPLTRYRRAVISIAGAGQPPLANTHCQIPR